MLDNVYDYDNRNVEIIRKDGTALKGFVLSVLTDYEVEEITDPQFDVENDDGITVVCLSDIEKITILK